MVLGWRSEGLVRMPARMPASRGGGHHLCQGGLAVQRRGHALGALGADAGAVQSSHGLGHGSQ
eukprot:10238906-Alexandrium_andersonii.AAC.1